MGIDGFSMAQLGLHKDMTSAQLANQAEQLAQKGTEFQIKDISELAAKQKIEVRKDGKGSRNKEQPLPENEFEEIQQEDEEDKEVINFDEADLKNFSVRINNKTDKVELFDKENNRIIEEITPEELMYVIKRLNGASGIMVNKRI